MKNAKFSFSLCRRGKWKENINFLLYIKKKKYERKRERREENVKMHKKVKLNNFERSWGKKNATHPIGAEREGRVLQAKYFFIFKEFLNFNRNSQPPMIGLFETFLICPIKYSTIDYIGRWWYGTQQIMQFIVRNHFFSLINDRNVALICLWKRKERMSYDPVTPYNERCEIIFWFVIFLFHVVVAHYLFIQCWNVKIYMRRTWLFI